MPFVLCVVSSKVINAVKDSPKRKYVLDEALNFAFGFFPEWPAAGHKLQHKLLRQPRSPQTFSHRAPGLEFKSYNPAVFEKSTHQDAPSTVERTHTTHTCKIPNPGRPGQNVSRIALIVVFWLRAVTLCHQNLNDIGEPPSKIPMNGILEMVLDLGNAIRREELPQMTQNLSRELWKHQILVGFNSTRGSLMFEYSCWKAMMIIRSEHDYIMIIMIMTWWLWFCGFAIVCQSEANMP